VEEVEALMANLTHPFDQLTEHCVAAEALVIARHAAFDMTLRPFGDWIGFAMSSNRDELPTMEFGPSA